MKKYESLKQYVESTKDTGLSYVEVNWAGTDADLKINCICGKEGYVSGEFCNFFYCDGCGRRYGLKSKVELVELPDKYKLVVDENANWKTYDYEA